METTCCHCQLGIRGTNWYREDIVLQTLLLLFKFANRSNKRPFGLTANEALVSTFMTISDVNDIFSILSGLLLRVKKTNTRSLLS